jgi:membrane-associated protein
MAGRRSPKPLSLEHMFDVGHLIEAGGLLLIAAIIFGESGMFIGFFFPGDTLLLSAGVFAAHDKLELISLIPVVAIAAIIGDNVGYFIGKRYGHRLFDKEDGVLFRKEYVDRAHKFFKRYGNEAMLFAHFFPIIRTFAPPIAGVAEMNHRRFFIYDALGDTVWATSVVLVGYWFGTKVHNLDHYILLGVVAAMGITLVPTFWHLGKRYLKKRRRSKI